jgi:hypothetical protein
MTHLPSVVARLGETECRSPDSRYAIVPVPHTRAELNAPDTYHWAAQPGDQSLITCWT